MKKILLLALITLGHCLNAQNIAATCENAYSLCNNLGVPFLNTTNGPAASTVVDTAYGCLFTRPNQTWFYLPVNQSGDLQFLLQQNGVSGNTLITLDFVCWGPFSSTVAVCNAQNISADNIVDCGYGPGMPKTLDIPNATAGAYYVLMVTNFSNLPAYITINAAGNTSQSVFDCAQLAAKNTVANNFLLYPNPAKHIVNVTAAINEVIATVKIYDLSGKTIYTNNTNISRALTVDTSAFAAGTYFVEVVNSANAKTIKKLIVE